MPFMLPLSRRIGSEKLTFLPDFKCRSEGLRFRAERHSRRKQTKTAFRSVYTKRLSGQAGAREKGARCAIGFTDQTEQKGCRLRSFKCEDKGVYQNVNDRSPNHEERAQDAPLCSVWRKVRDLNPRKPYNSNGFQDRRFRPLSQPSLSVSLVFRSLV